MVKRMVSARRTSRLKKNDFKIELESHVAREVGAVIYLGLAIIFYLVMTGKAGILGAWVNTYLRLVFGVGVYALPVIFLGFAVTLFLSHRIQLDATRYLGIILLVFSGLGIVHMRTPMEGMLDNVEKFGGYVGFITSVLLRIFLSDTGARVVLIAAFLIAILITFEVSFRDILAFFLPSKKTKIALKEELEEKRLFLLTKGEEEELNIVKPLISKNAEGDLSGKKKKGMVTESKKEEEKPKPFAINKPEPIAKTHEVKMDERDYTDWQFPPLDLLSSASSQVFVSDDVLKSNAEKIRDKLGQFGIEVTMKDVNIGPTVLQYTLKPAEDVKIAKITALKNDLALALAAKSIRIEAPIPGKPLVGIEVPNEKRMVVHIRELLESGEFKSINSKLRLTVGRDVSGLPVIDDLASMPHLLIAGATGSGKSVAINAFLISLLYQNSPRDLRFIMIDPKRVELTTYNGIPHLLTPVITETEKAHSSLKWACAEMHRRYKELAEKGYRNIEEYNQAEPKVMHKIVIVVDELATLMMQATKKETETLICRIAQMARAVGMHLILATQRPSVDVITGVIKANIPTRMAFTVISGVDSKTIIDTVGAEDLLGMGDMLYLPGNRSSPIRLQGVYVSSKEIERVTNRVKLTIEPNYDETVTSSPPSFEGDTGIVGTDESGMEQDSMYNDAIQVIKETGKASASLLQRRLSVGYARAARILDLLEEHGLIGPVDGAKPREIYITDNNSESH